jgi:hypothetical protein
LLRRRAQVEGLWEERKVAYINAGSNATERVGQNVVAAPGHLPQRPNTSLRWRRSFGSPCHTKERAVMRLKAITFVTTLVTLSMTSALYAQTQAVLSDGLVTYVKDVSISPPLELFDTSDNIDASQVIVARQLGVLGTDGIAEFDIHAYPGGTYEASLLYTTVSNDSTLTGFWQLSKNGSILATFVPGSLTGLDGAFGDTIELTLNDPLTAPLPWIFEATITRASYSLYPPNNNVSISVYKGPNTLPDGRPCRLVRLGGTIENLPSESSSCRFLGDSVTDTTRVSMRVHGMNIGNVNGYAFGDGYPMPAGTMAGIWRQGFGFVDLQPVDPVTGYFQLSAPNVNQFVWIVVMP